MKKEFVPYELALKIKELGFDEPCFGFYYDDGELQIKEGNHYPLGYLNAPLFQQAFRWFREPLNGSYNHLDFMYEYLKNDSMSYEEAELACLEKLIEIKNK
jgi:hypothetical protein